MEEVGRIFDVTSEEEPTLDSGPGGGLPSGRPAIGRGVQASLTEEHAVQGQAC